jgi:hypothetical protein
LPEWHRRMGERRGWARNLGSKHEIIRRCRRLLRACSTLSASSRGVEQALSLCFDGQLYRRAAALIADAALSAADGRN